MVRCRYRHTRTASGPWALRVLRGPYQLDPSALVETCHEWSRRRCNKASDLTCCCRQQIGDVPTGRVLHSNHDDPRRMFANRCDFGRAIADVSVLRDRHPVLSTYKRDPVFVRSIRGQVVVVYFDRNPLRAQMAGYDFLSEIPVEKQSQLFRRLEARTGLPLRFPRSGVRSHRPVHESIRPTCSVRR